MHAAHLVALKLSYVPKASKVLPGLGILDQLYSIMIYINSLRGTRMINQPLAMPPGALQDGMFQV
jgi:hypothetical protein